jgi:hypothetical protein
MKNATRIVVLACICLLTARTAFGDVIAFEWLPGTNSTTMSLHGVGGPVLADDFIPAVGGAVTRVDWWGTTANSTFWEITLHADNAGVPLAQAPLGGISQHTSNLATVTGPDANGVFGYSVVWSPQDVVLNAGTEYWFSVANGAANWNWALPDGGPTVGSESYHAARSIGVGPNGGPHFGPWDNISEPDYAFRIWVIPEPTTFTLAVSGIAILGLLGNRRWRKQAA